MSFTAIELCAGGGGQALGLEMAGFHHVAAVEYEPHFCTTLRTNRPHWKVIEDDIRNFRSSDYSEIDLIAGGVPCPPFSIAGKQLGGADERDMFPTALKIIESIRPRAVLLENVPGLASKRFEEYRRDLLGKFFKLGYQPEWKVLQSSHFGVPQLRPRFILVALRPNDAEFFEWPDPNNLRAVCTNCNEGLQNTALPKPDQVWLLSQIRRATIDDQKAVMDWLHTKFGSKT